MSLHSKTLTPDRLISEGETVPYVRNQESHPVTEQREPAPQKGRSGASGTQAPMAPQSDPGETAADPEPRRGVRQALIAGASLAVLDAPGYLDWEYWNV